MISVMLKDEIPQHSVSK